MKRQLFTICALLLGSIFIQTIANSTGIESDQGIQSISTTDPNAKSVTSVEFVPKEYAYRDFKLPYREVRVNFDNKELSDQPALLVVLLHSRHCSGRGNNAHLSAEGVNDILEYLTVENEKAVFIIPQVPDGREWNESYPYQKFYMSDLLKTMIEDFIGNEESNIDPNKVYLMGASMGGSGVWRMVNDYPELFAGVLTTAAKPKKVKPERLVQVPILAVEGTHDKWAKPAPVRKFLDKVGKKGGTTKLVVLPDRTHRQTCQQAFSQDNLKWVFSKKKGGK